MKDLYTTSKALIDKYKEFDITSLPKNTQEELMYAQANINSLHEMYQILKTSEYPFDEKEYLDFLNMRKQFAKTRQNKV